MKTYAVDFETSYTKDRSIGTHGTLGYLAHPDTDIFMVAVVGEGIQYVGPPKDAPWDLVRGNRVVAHNYSFEWAVLRECERRGIIKEPLNETGFCTANLSAYLQAPRNLLGASQELLGIQLDKTTRDKFKNKNFHTLPDAIKEEITGYALMDAKACYTIWEKFRHLWPEHEQLLSDHTTLMGHRGIPANEEAIENGIRTYKEILWGLEKLIPWAGTNPVMSLPQLRDACRKAGIPAPESTAKDDEDFQVWADTYADKVPFVAAVSQYRSINRSLGVLEAMQVRTLDSRVRYGLKYCGAVPTFRWSGDTGLNVQNQSREPVGGIDLRTMFEAPAGKSFISADMSQIEPRVALWVTKNEAQLELVRKGMCVYEVHARQTLGYNLSISLKDAAKKDPHFAKMRQFSKARCLSADTLVLTDRGYLPIVQVLITDKLWDGLQWVPHDGVIYKGNQKTIQYGCDQYTDDHDLFTGEHTKIQAGQAKGGLALSVARHRTSASSWYDVWALACCVFKTYSHQGLLLCKPALYLLWQGVCGSFKECRERANQRLF
jgi:hypothetical protein